MEQPVRPAEPASTAASGRVRLRTAVVWDALERVLSGGPDGEGPGASVVDVGGGTGEFAVRVAELGHRVTVVDPSPDALAALDRRARERGVDALVGGRLGDLADLPELVGEGRADLVLCHDVLGVAPDPAAGLAAVHRVLAPGGTLSLLVGQRHAAVVARAMAGHLQAARETLDQQASGERRFTASELVELVREAGFAEPTVHAVRVFTDLVPSNLLDLEPGAQARLLDLERTVATMPDYLSLAAQLHLLARR